MAPGTPPAADVRWHRLEIAMLAPARVAAAAEVYIPPAQSRFVVISDIDDTVMHTGVANKAAMLWRLFVQDAESRTVFPGVSHLYRALHAGASGDEANAMLYISRAPWASTRSSRSSSAATRSRSGRSCSCASGA
jgi:phosphatidate phosphatase APP1